MKPIYSKNIETGSHFKFVPEPNITQKQWDMILDAHLIKNSEFITEEEFNKHHEGKRTTTIDVRDEEGICKVGEITCEYLDLDNIENEHIL